MAITDICILVGIALFALLGFRDGFFRKLFGIMGLIIGLLAATRFMGDLGENIVRWLDFSPDVSYVLAFSFLFMFSMVIVNILYRWFGRSSRETLSMRSRFVGAILGIGQGLVSVSLLLIMFGIFDIPASDERDSAVFYEPIRDIAPTVYNYTTSWLPESKDFFELVKTKFEGKP